MDTATLDISALTDDGDTLELPDGRTLRLRITPDDRRSITDDSGDGMWCGTLEWVPNQRSDGRSCRPVWANGAARILSQDRWSSLWWQPPMDVVKDPDALARLERTIRDIMDLGYVVVTLELTEGADAYGRPVVVAFDSIGTEWSADGYVDLVAGMVPEVLS